MSARLRLPGFFLLVAGIWTVLSVRPEPLVQHEPGLTWIYDFYHLFRPNTEVLAARLAQGDLPLWEPRHSFGEPFLAAIQPGVLYPPNWLHVPLPTQAAFVVLVALHVALAGVFAALFARHLGAGPSGALLAGTLYAGSHHLFLLAWNPHMLYAAAWLPAVWWAVLRCIEHPSRRATVCLAAFFALQILAGWPQICMITVAATAVHGTLALAQRGWRERRPPWAAVGALGLGLGGALGLAAPQWLPTSEMLGESTRALGILPVAHTAGDSALYDPAPFFRSLLRNGRNDGVASAPSLLFVALAFLTASHRAARLTVLGLGLTALAASFPHALPVHGWLGAVPLVGDFRFPFRYRLVTVLSLALLAGVGASALSRRLAGRRAGALVVASFVALSLLPLLRPRPPAILFPFSTPPTPSFEEEYEAVAGEPPPRFGRIYWVDRAERIGHASEASVLFDFEPFFLARSARLLTYFEAGYPSVFQPLRELAKGGVPVRHAHYGRLGLPEDGTRAQLLDVMGVARIVTPDPPAWLAERYPRIGPPSEVFVFANPRALPRAYRVSRVEPTPQRVDAALARLASPGFDPRRSVLLDRVPEGLDPDAAAGHEPVTIERSAPEHVVLRSRGEHPGVVVLGDVDYPGWEATVDGQPAPILRANTLFRAVFVAAGERVVEFRYRPLSVRLGFAFAAVAGLALAAAALPVRRMAG